jgi:transcriptional repressor NrdR
LKKLQAQNIVEIMRCPFCQYQETNVIDSRDTKGGDAIRRRRVCVKCQKRFTTYEVAEDVGVKVIKKSGKKEHFKREKLKKGIIKATWRRPISVDQVDEIVGEIETRLRSKETQEIKSWEIGNLVLRKLRKLDNLAYLLFASVYRDFKSMKDFEDEIKKLKN